MRQEIITSIDNIIDKYNQKLAEALKVDKSTLDKIWSGETTVKQSTPVAKENTSVENSNEKELKKLKKPELKNLCKEKGLKLTGTKAELISRLLTGEVQTETKKVTKKSVKDKPSVVKKLQQNLSALVIRRNAFGNLEHSESSMIFDRKTKKVIGKQNKDGTVDELTPDDIDICNKYKFEYNLPENLDLNSGLDDVDVEELEEELDDEEIIEEEEEIVEDDDETIEEEEEEYEYEEIVEFE